MQNSVLFFMASIRLFLNQTTYDMGTNATYVVVKDFNREDKPDLLAASHDENNIGAFGVASLYAVEAQPVAVAVGDLNNDNISDLVVVNSYAYDINILLGRGNGSFYPRIALGLMVTTKAITIGDINLDNK